MKVLHVVSNISVGNGIMSVLMNYYRNIDREKVQFGFLYSDERPITYEDEIVKLGGSILKIPNAWKIVNFINVKEKLIGDISDEYQILHIHDVFMISFFLDVKKKWGIKKIIVHSHSTRFSDNKFGEIRNRLLAIPNSVVPDYYFACSEDAGVFAFGKKFLRKGFIIKNAIDLDVFLPNINDRKKIRKKLHVENNYVIGHVGGFITQKNHYFLVQVFKRFCQNRKDAKLIMVSDGPLLNEIKQLCKQEKIEDKVLFLGTRSDIPDIMKAFDCFVFPSNYEGLGIVLVEAQTSGIPCVFSDVVPKEVNILKERNTVLSLEDDIEKWVSAIGDKEFVDSGCIRKKIQEAGYDIKNESLKLQKLYIRILNEK